MDDFFRFISIFHHSGLPIYYLNIKNSLKNRGKDKFLISGFLSALSSSVFSFGEENHIKQLNMDKNILVFDQDLFTKIFVCIGVDSNFFNRKISKKIKKLIENLFDYIKDNYIGKIPNFETTAIFNEEFTRKITTDVIDRWYHSYFSYKGCLISDSDPSIECKYPSPNFKEKLELLISKD